MNRRDALLAIADALDEAVRQGAPSDTPEGARYITISDTLAGQWAAQIRQATQYQAIGTSPFGDG